MTFGTLYIHTWFVNRLISEEKGVCVCVTMMHKFYVTLCFMAVAQVNSQVLFGEMSSFFKLSHFIPSINETTEVFLIQKYIYKEEHYIFGTETALYTIHMPAEGNQSISLLVGDDSEHEYLEGEGGNARFSYIAGMVQHRKRGIFVTDYWNHCVRLIKSTSKTITTDTWKTMRYAGICEEPGSNDGQKRSSRFNHPQGLTSLKNKLYIADSYNKKIRRLDLITEQTTTVHESWMFRLSHLIVNTDKNIIYATANHGVLRVQDRKETWLVGCARESLQWNNSQFSGASFSNPGAIAKINDDLFIVSDITTHTLRLLDLHFQEVQVIGAGYGTMDGNINEALLRQPTALTVLDDTILIGEQGGVRRLPYKLTRRKTTTTRAAEVGECETPPSVSNAVFIPLDSYPEESIVFYQCIDGYSKVESSKSQLFCVRDGDTLLWTGKQIRCQPSTTLIVSIVLGVITIILLPTITIIGVRLRKVCSKLHEMENKLASSSQRATRRQFEKNNLPEPIISPTIHKLDTDPYGYETLAPSYIDLSRVDESSTQDSSASTCVVGYNSRRKTL